MAIDGHTNSYPPLKCSLDEDTHEHLGQLDPAPWCCSLLKCRRDHHHDYHNPYFFSQCKKANSGIGLSLQSCFNTVKVTKELMMILYKTKVHTKIYNGMISKHLYIAELLRENNVPFAMVATPWSNIHLKEEGNSNNMMTKLTWICDSSMRKYQ